ncbi:MAG TPA: MarR family winged helix-turn-helix transcriptional regulator [Actinophytocola sp.]|jgi:DNA-binding MarR family transcriptional regulator|nr:MarR family winged helix-turn-helix transcriptional regulator [Actinophytocola sp.]
MARTVGTEQALELVVAMHRLLRGLRRTADAAGLAPTQLIVLALLLQHGPSRIGELAGRVPCSQPTATVAVAGLQTAGLARREPDPTDGRATRVHVTDAGRAALYSVAHGEAETLASLLTSLPAADVDLLLAAAPLLANLAERVRTGGLATVRE